MPIPGLAPHTAAIFEKLSHLDCLAPYVLVGGTALSLQIGHRQSEDLDFMSWRKSKKDKCEVEWNKIADQLKNIGRLEKTDLLGFDHVEFVVGGVKLSFYACDKYTPVKNPIPFLNNIRLADIEAIGAMKMEVMLRRATFRDYYDIYSILKTGVDINRLIDSALKYSDHKLKSKNLISLLTRSEAFAKDASFDQLSPIYDLTPAAIESYLKSLIS